jgi:hypothetical protein
LRFVDSVLQRSVKLIGSFHSIPVDGWASGRKIIAPFLVKTAERFHFCQIEIQDGDLCFKTIDINSDVFDCFYLSHAWLWPNSLLRWTSTSIYCKRSRSVRTTIPKSWRHPLLWRHGTRVSTAQ